MAEPLSPFATIEEMSAALSAGAVSSVELTRAHLDRIEADPALRAFAEVNTESALAAAQVADTRRANGDGGPLLGVPLAVKDIFDIAGQRTRSGSLALDDRLPTTSATAVVKLEAAGMVVLGRTEMVEFAYGGWGTNPVRGAPRNPWDRSVHRTPGGSSSGSGVAVAAGLAPAALGTDTGGSVRTPAAWCGIVGMKTSLGLVSRSGAVPLAPTHDTVGPMTRSVRDASLLIEAMSGPDPLDPPTLTAPELDLLSGIEAGVRGMRIGILHDSDLTNVEPPVRALCDDATRTYQTLGATITKIALPLPAADYMAPAGDIMSFEGNAWLGRYVEADADKVDPVIAERILRGKAISDTQYEAILAEREEAHLALAAAIDGIDAILMPGAHLLPIPLAEVDEAQPPNRFGRIVNYLDLASLVVPVGLASGLPVGIQIVVRKFDDALALRIGRSLEREHGQFGSPPGY